MGQRKDQLIGFVEREYPMCSWGLFDCVMRAVLHRDTLIADEDGTPVEGDLTDEEIENGLLNGDLFLIDGGHMANRFENGYGEW